MWPEQNKQGGVREREDERGAENQTVQNLVEYGQDSGLHSE